MRIIDIHTHGLDSYDTRTTNPDDILKIAELHASQGVTDIFPTIYPGPVGAMRQHMEAVREAMARQAINRSRFGAKRSATNNAGFKVQNSRFSRIAGVHLEGPFLNPIKSGALDPSSFRKPSEKTWNSLIEGFEQIVKIVTIAPELEGALKLIRTMSGMGIVVSLGHSDATYTEAEEAFHAGAKGITHLFNAMKGFHHREPGIAGFGLMNPDIYVEIIADPFHLSHNTIELIFKVKNPEKIIIVSDSVKETETRAYGQATQGTTGTLRGGNMTITETMKRLVGFGFDETRVLGCISANPLSYLSSEQ